MKRLLALLALAAAGAQAADKPLWELGVGAGGLRLPAYRGSAHTQSWLLPVPYAVYRGEILRADRQGARARLFEHERYDLDLSATASAPAQSEDDPARAGMPDLKGTVELGPKFNATLGAAATWKLQLRVPLRAVATIERQPRHIGWQLAPVLNLDLRLAQADVGLQAGPLWGDARLHRHFYGVAPQYATAQRPAYAARGGYAGWQATMSASRRVGDFWLAAYLRTDSVAGAAFEDSPLVTRRRNVSGGFAVVWVFAASGTRVAADD